MVAAAGQDDGHHIDDPGRDRLPILEQGQRDAEIAQLAGEIDGAVDWIHDPAIIGMGIAGATFLA